MTKIASAEPTVGDGGLKRAWAFLVSVLQGVPAPQKKTHHGFWDLMSPFSRFCSRQTFGTPQKKQSTAKIWGLAHPCLFPGFPGLDRFGSLGSEWKWKVPLELLLLLVLFFWGGESAVSTHSCWNLHLSPPSGAKHPAESVCHPRLSFWPPRRLKKLRPGEKNQTSTTWHP